MPINVSASALRDYIQCEQKVYFRLFEPEASVQNKEANWGEITHKVLEKEWWLLDRALEYANDLCNERNVDGVGVNSIKHFIHTYFEKFRILVRDDDKIEKFFKVKLLDDVYLVGKLDRITMGTVIDWKTDANPPKKLSNNVQFIIYDMAYKLIYGKPAEGLYLASLKDGSLVRYIESKQHADTLITQIIPDYIKMVRSKEFTKNGLFNGSCYRCPYKRVCLGEENELVYPAVAKE